MKTRVLVSILIPILICILLIGGCATTVKPKKPPRTRLRFEPTNEDSSAIIGRIKLTCEIFPMQWRVKGDYTNGIVMHLYYRNTTETFTVTSRGADGFLYLLIDDPGQYARRLAPEARREGYPSEDQIAGLPCLVVGPAGQDCGGGQPRRRGRNESVIGCEF